MGLKNLKKLSLGNHLPNERNTFSPLTENRNTQVVQLLSQIGNQLKSLEIRRPFQVFLTSVVDMCPNLEDLIFGNCVRVEWICRCCCRWNRLVRVVTKMQVFKEAHCGPCHPRNIQGIQILVTSSLYCKDFKLLTCLFLFHPFESSRGCRGRLDY